MARTPCWTDTALGMSIKYLFWLASVFTCVRIRIYVHISMCMYVYMYTCMYVCMYVYVYICIYIYMYICVCVYVCTCTYVYIHDYMHNTTHTYTHMCIHIHIHIYMYATTLKQIESGVYKEYAMVLSNDIHSIHSRIAVFTSRCLNQTDDRVYAHYWFCALAPDFERLPAGATWNLETWG